MLRSGCLCLLVFFGIFSSYAEKIEFEGFFKDHVGQLRFDLIAMLIPYNPNILVSKTTSQIEIQCAKNWPIGKIFQSDDQKRGENTIDLIWIESEDAFSFIKNHEVHLNDANVVYTKTHPSSFHSLRLYLEQRGYHLLSHWHSKEPGEAIFLKNETFNAMSRSMNFIPTFDPVGNYLYLSNIDEGLRKIDPQQPQQTMEGIDFIYMINLDERPEKFRMSSRALAQYDLSTFRFPAVNGWKLPHEVIQEVGVKYFYGMLPKKYMGTSFVSVDGKEYISHEYFQNEGKTYFFWGMTRGAIGIVLSHVSVLQNAYESHFSTIWVMEDDIQIVKDPSQISALIKELDVVDPEWDILFTDTDTKDINGQDVPCRALAMRPNYKIQPVETYLKLFYPVSNNLMRIGMRYGSYSMIIRRSGIRKILNYYKKYGVFLPYDMDFWLNADLKMYSSRADIVSTLPKALSDNGRPGYSL